VALTLEQAGHATTIAAVASRLAMPNRAVTIALATVLQESGLRNLDYGDRDSVGLFQQRPSQGWGSVDEIMSPEHAATTFYERLARVPGWRTMSVNDAAQTVQRSGFPEAYGQWEGQARLMARAFTGEEPGAFTCRAEGKQLSLRQDDINKQVASQFKTAAGGPSIGDEVSAQRGWMTASWLVAHADSYGVRSITFNGSLWQASTDKWEAISQKEMVVRYNV